MIKSDFKEYSDIIAEIERKQKANKDLKAINKTDLRCMRCGVPLIGHEIGLYQGLCQDCNGQQGSFL